MENYQLVRKGRPHNQIDYFYYLAKCYDEDPSRYKKQYLIQVDKKHKTGWMMLKIVESPADFLIIPPENILSALEEAEYHKIFNVDLETQMKNASNDYSPSLEKKTFEIMEKLAIQRENTL